MTEDQVTLFAAQLSAVAEAQRSMTMTLAELGKAVTEQTAATYALELRVAQTYATMGALDRVDANLHRELGQLEEAAAKREERVDERVDELERERDGRLGAEGARRRALAVMLAAAGATGGLVGGAAAAVAAALGG